jgi:hypothetical protein
VALLVLQVVDITLPFRIGHAFVTTLCILRQPTLILAALAIRHSFVSPLFITAEPSEFEVYRRVGAEAAGVVRVKPRIPMVATDAGITAPIGGFEPGAVIPPISLLGRPIIPACLILQTLSVTRIDHGIEAANDVASALG